MEQLNSELVWNNFGTCSNAGRQSTSKRFPSTCLQRLGNRRNNTVIQLASSVLSLTLTSLWGQEPCDADGLRPWDEGVSALIFNDGRRWKKLWNQIFLAGLLNLKMYRTWCVGQHILAPNRWGWVKQLNSMMHKFAFKLMAVPRSSHAYDLNVWTSIGSKLCVR